MAQLARIPAMAVPPCGNRPSPRWPARWWTKPLASLLRAWRAQSDLWERWYVAPYKDDGPLRWQCREGLWVLDCAELSAAAERKAES